jgi:hypothetical protein
MVLREPINICNTEAAVGYPEGERDLKSLEPATLKVCVIALTVNY